MALPNSKNNVSSMSLVVMPTTNLLACRSGGRAPCCPRPAVVASEETSGLPADPGRTDERRRWQVSRLTGQGFVSAFPDPSGPVAHPDACQEKRGYPLTVAGTAADLEEVPRTAFPFHPSFLRHHLIAKVSAQTGFANHEKCAPGLDAHCVDNRIGEA